MLEFLRELCFILMFIIAGSSVLASLANDLRLMGLLELRVVGLLFFFIQRWFVWVDGFRSRDVFRIMLVIRVVTRVRVSVNCDACFMGGDFFLFYISYD